MAATPLIIAVDCLRAKGAQQQHAKIDAKIARVDDIRTGFLMFRRMGEGKRYRLHYQAKQQKVNVGLTFRVILSLSNALIKRQFLLVQSFPHYFQSSHGVSRSSAQGRQILPRRRLRSALIIFISGISRHFFSRTTVSNTGWFLFICTYLGR